MPDSLDREILNASESDAMSSKTTFRAWQLAGEAAVAARRLADLVDAAQRDLLAPFRPEGSPGDWLESQLAVARMIEESAGKLMVLEDRYAQSGFEDRVRRAEARAEAVRLQRELAAARTLLLQHFGSNNGLALLGVGLKLRAARPKALARIGRQLVDVLRAPDFTLPDRPQAVARLSRADPAALAAAVEAALLPVETLLHQSDRLRQQVEIGKGARDTERDLLRDRVRRGLRFLEGLYRLVGLDYHADRLRALTRRHRSGAKGASGEVDGADGSTPRVRVRRSARVGAEAAASADRSHS
jgi:hypothetical protein